MLLKLGQGQNAAGCSCCGCCSCCCCVACGMLQLTHETIAIGLGFLGFQFLVLAVCLLVFQLSAFNFLLSFSSRRLSSLKTVNCIFIQFSIICLGSCSSGLCNFQMKYFPNAIHFCANCFPRLGFLCLRPLSAYFVLPLASVWPFHLAKSYLKLVKRRQTEITQLGNCRTCEMASHHIRFPLNYWAKNVLRDTVCLCFSFRQTWQLLQALMRINIAIKIIVCL